MIRKKISIGVILSYFVLVIWTVITIYPLIYTLISSLKTQTEMFSNLFGLPETFVFSNYMDLFTKYKFYRNIVNSLVLASMTVFFQVAMGAFISYILSQFTMKANNKLMLFLVVGMLVPVHAIIIPIAVMANVFNAYNNYWFIISVYIATGLPYMVFITTGFMKTIPKALVEASIVDGCNGGQIFWKIIFPLSRPILATTGILSFIGVWNELILALVLLKSNGTKTVSLALTLFAGERFSDFPSMCAAVIVAVAPSMVIYFMFQENIIKGMTAGAVKG